MAHKYLPVRAVPHLNGTTHDIGVSDHASIQDIFQTGGTARIWLSQLGVGDANPAILAKSDFATKGWYAHFSDATATTGTLLFGHAFSTSIGLWTSATTFDYNDPTLRLAHITYNASSMTMTTPPILYIRGNPETMTQVLPPTGSFVSDAGISLTIGSLAFTAGLQAFKGRIWGVGLLDSVLSAANCLLDWQSDSLADTSWSALWRMHEEDYASGMANTGSGGAGVASVSDAGLVPEYTQIWSGRTAPT